MKINGKIEVKGYTRVVDLDEGDVFIFLDEDDPYMKGVDRNTDDVYVINLRNGTVTEICIADWYDRPVEKLNAELVVK